jgi:putative peptide zinc metalloprotease protein
MTASLLSHDWYRVAFLRPRLRAGLHVARHRVRGEDWHVVTDPVSGRHHRFNRMAWRLVASCDGQRTLDEVWAALVAREGDDAPTQGETIDIISQAFGGHMLVGDIPPDAAAVVRVQSRARARRRRGAINPLAFRVPLWDPDAFLERHLSRVQWLFGAALPWLLGVAVLLAVVLLAAQGGAFARDAHALATSARGLMLLWLVYPFLKALHELAHGFAVKHYGGEVHTMGITLLLLTPVPYVDASASAALADKRQRALVAGVGIVTELLLAGAALALWSLLEPGLLRELACAVVVVGGVSTVLVNGNPLLRFDGYHVLADLAELPNLAQRSQAWWLQGIQRHVLGLPHSGSRARARGEAPWLAGYAPLSWLVRAALLIGLVVALVQPMPWVAVGMAAFGAWTMLFMPLAKALRWVAGAPQLAGRRTRAVGATLATGALAAVIAFAVPLPQRSHAPGLVWLPDEALVRLQVGGFVEAFLVRDGDIVEAGMPLVQLVNEPLLAALGKAQAELHKEEVQRAQKLEVEPLAAAQAQDRIDRLRAEVQSLAAQRDALVVRAGVRGHAVFDVHRDLVGMYLPQGHLIAQVIDDAPPLVRALVSNEDIALVRSRPGQPRVHLAQGGEPIDARSHAAVPQASAALPSAALGDAAGGSLALDAADPKGLTAREARFQVDVELPPGTRAPIGSRAMVTFEHGRYTAAEWVARMVRRSFLKHVQA